MKVIMIALKSYLMLKVKANGSILIAKEET